MGAGILLAQWGWSSCQKETLQDRDKDTAIVITITITIIIIAVAVIIVVINIQGGRMVW